jgi:hypothetical protein
MAAEAGVRGSHTGLDHDHRPGTNQPLSKVRLSRVIERLLTSSRRAASTIGRRAVGTAGRAPTTHPGGRARYCGDHGDDEDRARHTVGDLRRGGRSRSAPRGSPRQVVPVPRVWGWIEQVVLTRSTQVGRTVRREGMGAPGRTVIRCRGGPGRSRRPRRLRRARRCLPHPECGCPARTGASASVDSARRIENPPVGSRPSSPASTGPAWAAAALP